MRRIIGLCAALLMMAFAARAATVIAPSGGDMARRLEAAKARMRESEVGQYGMTPIPGEWVADGSYEVSVQSSSPFFRIVSATLEVDNGAMTLDFLIGSESYSRVCLATAEAADGAPWIEGNVVSGGTRFDVPVTALDQPFQVAAYSVNRERWYDRLLLVEASSLPEGALGFELPDYELIEKALKAYEAPGSTEELPPEAVDDAPEPVSVELPDGEYSIEVNLAGGSGRASVSSPTVLMVRDGRAWTRLLWSSPYYDYMLLGGTRYENLSTEGGNSTFEVPITAMDAPMDVVADTTAMGDPIEIEYRLTFYPETIGDKRQVPQEAAKQVLMISLAIIVVGGVLNHIVKRKRK